MYNNYDFLNDLTDEELQEYFDDMYADCVLSQMKDSGEVPT